MNNIYIYIYIYLIFIIINYKTKLINFHFLFYLTYLVGLIFIKGYK
jgi:hypothetical protein